MNKLVPFLRTNDLEKVLTDFNSVWLDAERAFEAFDRSFPVGVRSVNFPPVDIAKSETGYVITLAVAGFKRDELSVEVDSSGIISVSGKKETKTDDKYLVKGIATRQFARKWQLNPGDEVNSVKLEDGLLHVSIARNELRETIKKFMIE